jgi:hypothetical protein
MRASRFTGERVIGVLKGDAVRRRRTYAVADRQAARTRTAGARHSPLARFAGLSVKRKRNSIVYPDTPGRFSLFSLEHAIAIS